MVINYEQGRAYALSSISQDILHNPEAFAQWCNQFVAALKMPVASQPAPQSASLPQITIYTDGACTGNPGPGGWGAALMVGDKVKEIYDAEAETTNNRMELMAAIRALSALKRPCKVTLHSDSTYLVYAFTRNYLEGWIRRGWMKRNNTPVLNRDLWEQLIELTNVHTVTFVKVPGHASDKWNNRCDELAKAAIKQLEAA